jgi:propanol-preferring alcohol dehydrogenase
MSDIPSFPYSALWEERSLRSVANLTRQDAREFFSRIEQRPVQTRIERFPLERANDALQGLRDGKIKGAAVLVP